MKTAVWLAAALALAGGTANAQEIGVNAFSGAPNLPLWVGERQGFFKAAGMAVTLSNPKGSVDQFKGLAEGRYQIVITALDNVVAYRDGHGEADLGGPLDIVAFMGLDSGFLTLTASPGVPAVAELKGKTVVVDALTTGFSFALQELLARGGVGKDDVEYLTAGSSGARWKALQDGKAQAALLSMPFDLEAKDKGFTALATVAGTLGHYQGTVGAVRESWARAHGAELARFIEAYRKSVAWMRAPAHKDAALALMQEKMPQVAQAELPRILALLAGPGGVARNLRIDPAGAKMVLDLRARYAAPAARPAHALSHYIDARYLDEAH
jgi:ABC-type nitrate/sulfonate/bicarbonate transport system substrate-binding protein